MDQRSDLKTLERMLDRAGILYRTDNKGKFNPTRFETTLIEVPAHTEVKWDEKTKMTSVISVPHDVKREVKEIAPSGYDEGFTLKIEAKDGVKNDGYVGFYAQYIFDKDGKLLETGIWE